DAAEVGRVGPRPGLGRVARAGDDRQLGRHHLPPAGRVRVPDIDVAQLGEVVLLDVREDAGDPAPPGGGVGPAAPGALALRPAVVRVEQVDRAAVAGQRVEHVVVAVAGDGQLLDVVAALHTGGGLADLLDGRQEQPDQDRDDRNHHQQLDQC